MDKIFEQNIIEQDSILCKIELKILEIILKYLPPNNVVHLSHTCKELHQKLPFYLKKSIVFIMKPLKKLCYPWFDGTAINFSIKEIKISFTLNNILLGIIALWIQFIRRGIVVFETQKYFIRNTKGNFQINKAALKEYKHGDRFRFVAQNVGLNLESQGLSFQVSVLLENYEYGKPINVTKKVKGYTGFKRPPGSIDVENVSGPFYTYNMDLISRFHGLFGCDIEGNTNF